MRTPLKLKTLTTHTCLAQGAELNGAAMRCGYDGFKETTFTQPHSIEMQLGATIEIKDNQRGLEKLIYLCGSIIESLVKELDIDLTTLPIYLCLQDINQPSHFSFEELQKRLFQELATTLNMNLTTVY